MEYEKCYVFKPSETRSAKRQRAEPQGLQASWNLRRKAYHEAWQRQEARTHKTIDEINSVTIGNITQFLDRSLASPGIDRIPSALILAGPGSALHASLVSKALLNGALHKQRVFVSLSSGAAPNLKGLLKFLVQKITSENHTDEDDEDGIPDEDRAMSKSGPKLLGYDLQLVQDHVNKGSLRQVVITIEDTEAFDSDLLSELIEMLGCWQDRIPFVLLFHIATSTEFLQQRLSRAAVRCIDGRLFDAAKLTDEIERVFEAITDPSARMVLGPGLAALILERQRDYMQSVDSLADAAKYALMSGYYANALTAFLDPEAASKDIPSDHYAALRNVPSFRDAVHQLLEDEDFQTIRGLLDSDRELHAFAVKHIAEGRQAVRDAVTTATQLIPCIQRICQSSSQPAPTSALYIQAMSGSLHSDSTLLRTLLLAVRKSSSSTASHLLQSLETLPCLSETTVAQLRDLERALQDLKSSQNDSTQELRSEEDATRSSTTLRTTVIAQKVELSKQKSTLSRQDAAYTTLLRKLSDLLSQHFTATLIDPHQLVFHEIFIYDLKSPCREVFSPRPRQAIERALASPHDYLACSCCAPEYQQQQQQPQPNDDTDPDTADPNSTTLAATQPATAVLYQLYLETGSLINVSDLWQAFHAVLRDRLPRGEQTSEADPDPDEQRIMALFQRALAELKYIGLLKPTRKKADHVAKVAWRGL